METVVVTNKRSATLHTSSLSNFAYWFVHMEYTNLETATVFAVQGPGKESHSYELAILSTLDYTYNKKCAIV